jgi:hypothetical protein
MSEEGKTNMDKMKKDEAMEKENRLPALVSFVKPQIEKVKLETAARLMEGLQNEHKARGNGFVKHFGDSADQKMLGGSCWNQILRMNRETFNRGFNEIGITYNSEEEFNRIKDGKTEFQGKLYCRVKTSYKKRTLYYENGELIESLTKTDPNNQELALAE